MKYKLNKWAFAAANTVAAFYVVGAALIYAFGDRALNFIERIHLMRMSDDIASSQATAVNFVSGLITHYVVTYIFVVVLLAFYNRARK